MVSKYWTILKAGTIKLFNFCNSDIGGINDLLDEETVYPSQSVKFLGVLPDDRLNYHSLKQRIFETYVFINVHISILRTFKQLSVVRCFFRPIRALSSHICIILCLFEVANFKGFCLCFVSKQKLFRVILFSPKAIVL